jgi:hypothetical protein
MKRIRLFCLMLALAALPAIGACEKEGPAERAGEKIDEAAEKAADSAEDAADRVEEAVER